MNSIVGLNSTIVLPTLLQDIIDKADKWGNDGKNGRIDPFTEIYDVRFRHHMQSVFWTGAEFPLFSSFSS